MKDPMAQFRAALSRSASGKTIALAFPPSSMRHGFRCFPASDAMMLPTLELPVKLIFFTWTFSTSCCVKGRASSGRWKIRFRHPSGSPACRKTSAIAQ